MNTSRIPHCLSRADPQPHEANADRLPAASTRLTNLYSVRLLSIINHHFTHSPPLPSPHLPFPPFSHSLSVEMSSSESLPQETIIQQSPAPRSLSQPVAEEPSPSPLGRASTDFLDLPLEILTQIANETHAVDAYNLRLVHPQLYHLFQPENNLFWFKATFKDYVVHYGPPPKPTPSNSETPDPVPPELSQLPIPWDTIWQLNRHADSVRGSSKHTEQLYKYDANFKYFERIQSILKGKRGCQVCCVGSYQESKPFGNIKRRLCTFCFDDMTISTSRCLPILYLRY